MGMPDPIRDIGIRKCFEKRSGSKNPRSSVGIQGITYERESIRDRPIDEMRGRTKALLEKNRSLAMEEIDTLEERWPVGGYPKRS